MTKTVLSLAVALLVSVGAAAQAADYLEKTDFQKSRAFSPAVVTDGGRVVWMAGQTATTDGDGKDISGNFEAQARRVFALMDQTLRRTGGTLASLVTMTVFIKDARYGDRFVQIRREMFPDGNFPGSALITVSNFARPGMEIEIQGIAVVGDKCTNGSCSTK
ncbi:MAG: RidA family protein [Candidatus Rokuibacteriota bacterium]|nr:MAG: RidA family protein [Candidatus Rokubacteria bacterium]